GQDPYPTPGHPIGLSFADERDVRPLPRSLVNIYAELESDLGLPPAAHGDLSAWQDQGVLLLDRVLTVAPGDPASHRGRGCAGVRWWRVCAGVTRSLRCRCSARCPMSPAPSPARRRPPAAASGAGSAPGSTSCWRGREPPAWAGGSNQTARPVDGTGTGSGG